MYWRPDRAIAANPDWRPYYDNGQWTHTDNGLFWQSDYSWETSFSLWPLGSRPRPRLALGP